MRVDHYIPIKPRILLIAEVFLCVCTCLRAAHTELTVLHADDKTSISTCKCEFTDGQPAAFSTICIIANSHTLYEWKSQRLFCADMNGAVKIAISSKGDYQFYQYASLPSIRPYDDPSEQTIAYHVENIPPMIIKSLKGSDLTIVCPKETKSIDVESNIISRTGYIEVDFSFYPASKEYATIEDAICVNSQKVASPFRLRIPLPYDGKIMGNVMRKYAVSTVGVAYYDVNTEFGRWQALKGTSYPTSPGGVCRIVLEEKDKRKITSSDD